MSEAAELASLRRQIEQLKGGGGGGTSGGMEPRIARLEKLTEQLAKDVGDLRVDLAAIKENVRPVATLVTDMATLKENVRHLPTKPWLFTTLASLLVVTIAIVGLLIRFLPKAAGG